MLGNVGMTFILLVRLKMNTEHIYPQLTFKLDKNTNKAVCDAV